MADFTERLDQEIAQRADEVACHDFDIKKFNAAIAIAQRQMSAGKDVGEFIGQLKGLVVTATRERDKAEILHLTVLQLRQNLPTV
ncbi:MAG: hypothetical protein V4628_11420 [Pseudomonadota bacterium]